MKKLNNALNEVHDNYIEEAAKADRLESTTEKTVRNIAIPIASVAAVAGLCIGLNSMGVFGGKKGVELLPADSGSSANTSTSQTAQNQPNDYQYELAGYLPAEMPLVLQTQSDIESIIFGSEFPDMLYADEEKAIFTEGIGGVYVFDFATEQITLAADIYDSIKLSVDGYDAAVYDSWNGVSIFALEDGTICCSLAASRYSTISSQTDYDYEFYVVDTEELKLVRSDDMHENEPDLYDGLFDIPYGEGYSELSLKGARIGDTGEFVYIRNCTADIDLLTRYNMQLIELRRWTEGEPADDIINHMEGCWFPFDSPYGEDSSSDDFDAILDALNDEHADYLERKDVLEAQLQQLDQEIEDLREHIAVYEEMLAEATEQDIIDDMTAEIDVINQVLEQKCQKRADIETELDLIQTHLELTEAKLQEADEARAEQTEQEFVNYLTEELGATTSVTGLCPEFSAILGEWTAVTTYFGYDEWRGGTHYGIDYAAESGADIYAAADGIAHVPQNDSDWLSAFGKAAIIEHENGWFTVYAHANDIVVSDGEKVTAGQVIAHVGSTGWSTGPHLHFEVRQGVVAMDPLSHIVIPSETYSNFNAIIDEKKAELSPTANIPQLAAPINMELATLSERIYGNGGYYGHNGIDITAEYGTPVCAVADGKVVAADWLGGYGMCVILEHDGYLTLYAHLGELEATHGSDIKAGEQLGSVGSTGQATGNHLHFEIITASDDIVDPTEYLPEFLNDTSMRYE